RETEERFNDLLEVSSDWVWETDDQLRFTKFSGRLAEVSGVDPKALIGKTRTDIMDPSIPSDERQRHLEDLEARRPFREFSYRVITSAGPRYFKISGKPRFDASGRFTGYRGTGSDITGEIEAK